MRRLLNLFLVLFLSIGWVTANTVTATADVTLEGDNTDTISLDWYPIPELEVLVSATLSLPVATLSYSGSFLYTKPVVGFGAGFSGSLTDVLSGVTAYVSLKPISWLLIRADVALDPLGDFFTSLKPYVKFTTGPVVTTVGYDILAGGKGRFYASAVFTW